MKDNSDLNWKKLRKNKIHNYLIFSYIIAFMLLGLILIEIIFPFEHEIYLFRLSFFTIFMFFLFLIITYFVTKYLKNKTIMTDPTKINYLLFLMFITVITLTIYNDLTFDRYLIKVIYFVPIILGTINYGQSFGFFTAAYSSINLLLINFILNDFSNFDFDVIIIIVFFWVAWLIGGFIDLERQIQKHLEKLTITDELTGLPNYKHFQDTYDSWFQKAKNEQKLLSLAIMDLDNFKLFNDSLGHQKGDELLKKLAKLLENFITDDLFIARYGGDEFTFLFYNQTKNTACEKVSDIKNKIKNEIVIPYQQLLEKRLSCSFGIATFPKQAKDKNKLFDKADEALYLVKSSQEQQIRVYQKALNNISDELETKEIKNLNTIRTLLSIINAKDKYTYGHSERVMNYAEEMAKTLKLNKKDKKQLMYGAFLHDIGKIDIASKTLLKPKDLSGKDWGTIKTHPEVGFQILKPLNFSEDILKMVLYHHENFDGSGYNKKIKGKNIPFYARILRILDSFDAMTTNRPYSPALNKKEALKELKKDAGSQFEPELVEKFIITFNKMNNQS